MKVHDPIWARHTDGWRFRKGVYRKLRLAPDPITARLARAGFTVERHDAPAGTVALVARTPLVTGDSARMKSSLHLANAWSPSAASRRALELFQQLRVEDLLRGSTSWSRRDSDKS